MLDLSVEVRAIVDQFLSALGDDLERRQDDVVVVVIAPPDGALVAAADTCARAESGARARLARDTVQVIDS